MDEKLPALVRGAPLSDPRQDQKSHVSQKTGSQTGPEQDEHAAAQAKATPLHVLGSKAASLSVASLAGKADHYHSPAAGIVALVIIGVAVGATCLVVATVTLQRRLMRRVNDSQQDSEERELMLGSDDDDLDAV